MKKFFALTVIYALLVSSAYADVAITEANFPDSTFRKIVSSLYDTDSDDKLSDAEIKSIDIVNVSGSEISSLKGIEYFTSMKELHCNFNKLTSLDLSKNTQLEFLDCSSNDLTALDVSNNTKLTHLWCWNDGLTSINFPENVALRSFRADNNDLSNIDPLFSLVSNPLEISIGGNENISTPQYLITTSYFIASDDTALLDIGDYDNISTDTIAGYDSSLEELTFDSFVSGDNNGIKFSSAPEVITYKYDTGISDFVMTCVVYREGSDIKDRIGTSFNGIYIGTESNDVISWKGIPYAQAPVGSLRWKAPEALDIDMTTLYTADEFAPAALQPESAFTPASQTGNMSEDCLYLNIWKASSDEDDESNLKPVVVWIHGGSFQRGATSNAYYSGENFVRDNPDIIFVSVAYRLGIMGFIDFSQVSGGTGYPDSGNLGLLDMMQALRWVNMNIAAFGGDRDNITVMGQSAGASCVSMLMTIPESRNLFKRAILESGSVSMHTRKADALPLAQKLLAVTEQSDMEGLLSLTQDELLEAAETLQYSANFPETDDRILSKDLYAAFAQRAGSFDVLIGTNANELNYWKLSLSGESFDMLASYSFLLSEMAIGQYSSDDVMYMESFAYVTSGDYPEFFNELCFRAPAIQLAQSHTGNTYMYYWEYPAQNPQELNLLACHESELPYFLDNPAGVSYIVPYPVANVQENVRSMVSGFIRTGNPSTTSTTWPQYDTQTRTTMIFTETGDTETDDDPLSTQRELIMPLLKWGISGRELVNGDLSSGISVNPDAADTDPDSGSDPDSDPDPDPTTVPDGPGSSSGGCNSGISIMSAFILAVFMMRKRENNA